jgi:hypothetical protein
MVRARVLVLLAVIVALGGALRAWHAAHPTTLYQSADELSYGKLAIDLADNHDYGTSRSGLQDPLHWPPGAPALFALARTVHSDPVNEQFYDIPSAYWAQAAVSTATIPAVYGIAALLAGPAAGLVAAAALAAYPGAFLAPGDMLSEPLGALLLALGMLLVAWGWRRRRSPLTFAFAGVLLGLAILTRADLLLAPLALAPVVAIGLWRARGGRTALAATATLLIGVLVVVWPWVGWASGRAGKLVPVTRGSGTALFVGTYLPGGGTTIGMKRALAGQVRDKYPRLRNFAADALPATAVLDLVASRHPGISRDQALSIEGRRNLKQYLRHRPVAFLRMMGSKVWRMWKRYTRGGGHHTLPALEVIHLALVLLSLAGLIAGLVLARGRRLLLAAIAVPAAYGTLLHSVVVSQPRYNLPLVPLLFAAGAAGGVLALRRPAGSPVDPEQEPAEYERGPEVAHLYPEELIVGDREGEPEDEERGGAEPGAGRPGGPPAGERGLVERPRDEVQAHAEPHQRQAAAGVVEAPAEEDVHREGADRQEA